MGAVSRLPEKMAFGRVCFGYLETALRYYFIIINSAMRLFKVIQLLCIAGFMLVFCISLIVVYTSHISHEKELKELVGLYIIDSSELGTHDIYIDKRMSVEFKSNKTFELKNAMRNIYATTGTWSLGGIGIDNIPPNDLCYGIDKSRCCHFTKCFTEGIDTIMYVTMLFDYENFHTPLGLKFKKVNNTKL